jgi:chemotaxis protein methyltransferase CheR
VTARTQSPMAADPFYPRLKALIIERTGMAFYAERDDDLARILGERFAAIGVDDCASYLDRVADQAELDALVAELTIGETYFFRYKEQFEALRDLVLPEVIERNRERRSIRIWSAGCATGPEPYTVAIILKQRFGHLIEDWDVTVLGTDINRKFLAHARDGVYDDWAFRATPEAVRNACFERVGKRWRINPEYRSWVKFRYHNLVDDPFPSLAQGIYDVDVILCRNVVIYFTTETFRRIIGRFRESLADEGWLVVGHSELNNELFKAFRPVEAPGAVLYRKTEAAAEPPADPVDLFAAPPAPPPSLAALLAESPKPALIEPVFPEDAAAAPAVATGDSAMIELRRLADQGVWVEVARLARRLLLQEPLDALLHVYNGLALEHARDVAAAIEAMRRAVYLDRGLALAHYHLGRLLREQGDRPGAARSFRNSLRLIEPAAPDAVVPGTEDMAAAELMGLLRLQIEAVSE